MNPALKKLFAGFVLLLAGIPALLAQGEKRNTPLDVRINDPEKIFFRIAAWGYYQGDLSGNAYPLTGASASMLLTKAFQLQANLGILPSSVMNMQATTGFSGLKQPFVFDGRFTLRFKTEIKENDENKSWKTSDAFFTYTNTVTFRRKERNSQGLHFLAHVSVTPVGQREKKDSIFSLSENGSPVNHRSFYTNQTMTLLGVGYNVYSSTNFKAKAPEIGRTIRSRNTVNAYIELLYAPVISIQKSMTFIDKEAPAATEQTFEVMNPDQKVRFGARIVAEVSRGRPGWFMRVEMGKRPGYKLTFPEKEWISNGYIGMGFGLGF
jgi:hypothetical protein